MHHNHYENNYGNKRYNTKFATKLPFSANVLMLKQNVCLLGLTTFAVESIPTLDVVIGDKQSPLMVAASQTTASLYKCYNGELRKIAYPEI